ncbi:MAG: hypothetical protein JXR46_11965 [Calditrichaceae bacterium]|nr:hypothetical protein [Calditrichaceae bacterium]MBN2709751.1 hypothetical protein [Calditrichaceae bacterium]RQV94945.1 MAG: hypothetical protein EH224_08715 [Calditrichota bacterium]
MKKLWLCLMFMYSTFAFSQDKQEIEIIKVLDCNLFLSSDSQLIKLAYVKSPSITTSGETSWALWIKTFATVQLIKKPLYYIPVYSSLNRDTLYVHLFRGKNENLENINEYYLRLQCGEYFKPPDLPDLIAYRDAVNNPLPNSPKVSDPDFEENFINKKVKENKEAGINKSLNSARWFQLGVDMITKYDDLQFQFSMNYRFRNNIISIGLDNFRYIFFGKLKTIWGCYGFSNNSRWIDASFSAGLSYNESVRNIGLIFKFQALPHFPTGFGMGLVLTVNASKEASYNSLALVIALGSWKN